MTPKIRNIIIFVAIGVILILIYLFFFSSSTPQSNLVSSTTLPDITGGSTSASPGNSTPSTAGDFLTLLLNVQNIKLNDAIFSDQAWNNLHDSSITLIPDNTQGRPNPFAQFGNDIPAMPNIPNITVPATVIPPTTTTPPAAITPTTPAKTIPPTIPTTTKPATTKP